MNVRQNFQDQCLVRGDLFAERYRITGELGRGAFGIVYRAEDEITGEDVALKLLRENRARLASERWREASALRRLRIPGVATLYDEGHCEGTYYVAMEFVDGEHFFEPRDPKSWPEIRGHAVRLLEILSVVHRQGIVHGDLKPANVMRVGDDVKLLDFGLAISSIASDIEAEMGSKGTPIYMAPELFRDAQATPATDLFAVGTMLFEALTGQPFFQTGNFITWVRRLSEEGPPKLGDVLPKAHPEAQILVDALLQRKPEERPRSAANALELIERGRTNPTLRAVGAEPLSRDDLIEFFVGIEPGFHLRTGPADELLRRTLGDPDEVVAELEAWTKAGLAHYDGERFAVSSRALASLRDGLQVREPIDEARVGVEGARVAGLLQLGGEMSVDELCELYEGPCRGEVESALQKLAELGAVRGSGDTWRSVRDVEVDSQRGWLEEVAASLLERSDDPEIRLRVARVVGDPESVAEAATSAARVRSGAADTVGARSAFQEAWLVVRNNELEQRELLRSWAAFTLESNSLEIVEELLWVWSDPHDPICRLLEGYRLMLLGRNDRVVELLREIGSLSDPRFEVLRLGSMVSAMSWQDDEFEVVSRRAAELIEAQEELHDLRDASRMREASRLYGLGRFEAAAQIQMEVARMTRSKRLRVLTTFHAAWYSIDAFDFERAIRYAGRAVALSKELRLPQLELLSQVALRCASYRKGELPEPDDELLEAVTFEGETTLRSVAAMVESSIRWRRGEIDRAIEILRPVVREWDTGSRYIALLLLTVFKSFLERVRPRQEVIESVESCSLPRMKAQMLALMAPMVPGKSKEWRAEALSLVPCEDRSVRLEIVSIDEAVELR